MNNYSRIYWLTRLDSIKELLGWSIFVSVCVVIIYLILRVVISSQEAEDEFHIKRYSIYKNIGIWVFIISCLIYTFMPTRNEALIIMAGGKTLEYIQQDTSLSKIPYQTTNILSTLLENEIKKLNEKK
jgi:hypothetical protein